MKNVIDTAVEEAVEDTLIDIAKTGILEGLNNQMIAKLTNLSVDQIEKLRLNFKK